MDPCSNSLWGIQDLEQRGEREQKSCLSDLGLRDIIRACRVRKRWRERQQYDTHNGDLESDEESELKYDRVDSRGDSDHYGRGDESRFE